MSKSFTFLFLFLSNIIIYSQNDIFESNDSIIIWNKNRALKWNDFKVAKKDSLLHRQGSYYAITATELFVVSKKKKRKKEFFVYSIFWKYDSHVIMKTEELLRHEQIHFDIVELFARKLRKEYKNNEESLVEKYELIYTYITEELDNYQSLYDFETNHSKNIVKQKEWEEKIKKELIEYEDYSVDNLYR